MPFHLLRPWWQRALAVSVALALPLLSTHPVGAAGDPVSEAEARVDRGPPRRQRRRRGVRRRTDEVLHARRRDRADPPTDRDARAAVRHADHGRQRTSDRGVQGRQLGPRHDHAGLRRARRHAPQRAPRPRQPRRQRRGRPTRRDHRGPRPPAGLARQADRRTEGPRVAPREARSRDAQPRWRPPKRPNESSRSASNASVANREYQARLEAARAAAAASAKAAAAASAAKAAASAPKASGGGGGGGVPRRWHRAVAARWW